MSIPTFTSSRTGTIPVLNDAVDRIIPILAPGEQREFLSKLVAFRGTVEKYGDSPVFLNALDGVPAGVTAAEAKGMVLDMCNWKIAQGLRYSTPSRIAEAVPYIERVIAYFSEHNEPGVVDTVPEMYLGVALHKMAGQEDAALSHFHLAFEAAPRIEMQFHTQLWSRACYARLLRRMGKTEEAVVQEDMIRDWLHWHPYGMPPDEFIALVSDPEHEGKDHILEHPDVQNRMDSMVQIGPGMVIHFG
ncbi:hypothetical protein FB45DRAFT_918666 [Roridomyces roridus]|uniref:Tetratricopeptide repeat protein n=1 Tax=Roridomyces roridus TaxID=1738132 RepID=A0AAD7BRB9_9AGAR|nr:hypothetical protein FB45DRAFT_918666 [Roridomyces roridus]